jgi:hypothetical protein
VIFAVAWALLDVANYFRERLPPGYHIRLDAELFTLHRDDGSIVAAFVVGAALSEEVRTAEEDYRATGEAAS